MLPANYLDNGKIKPKKTGDKATPETEKDNIKSNKAKIDAKTKKSAQKSKGDEKSSRFEYAYKQFSRSMYKLALSFVKNETEAEDIVQNVFFKIANNYLPFVEGIDNDTDLKNYFLKSTKNAALNEKRRVSHQCVSIEDTESGETYDLPDVDSMDMLEMLAVKMEYKELVEIIRNLDEPYRDALYYHFVLDLTIPETAEHLERSVSAVKKQIVRSKRILLTEMRKRGVSEYAKK